MAKYSIIPGSIDLDEQSVGTSGPDGKNIKYLKGDLLAAFKAAKSEGLTTLEEVVSWQREQLEAGKPAIMKIVLSS